MLPFVKYPRTPHLAGSRLQQDDDSTGQIPVEAIGPGRLVFEEKIDGANAGLSFAEDGRLILQSRGHVLAGGAREAQFNLFKAWANTHEAALREIIGRRFIVYGEWMFAKHASFYDSLPHYFLEFDAFDRKTDAFLSTPARHALFAGTPIVSVPVVHVGRPKGMKALKALIQPSLYKSETWRAALEEAAAQAGVPIERAVRETDMNRLAEGLYLKHEDGDRVIGRYKFIRADFVQAILDSGSHWSERTIVANRLRPDVDIFAGA